MHLAGMNISIKACGSRTDLTGTNAFEVKCYRYFLDVLVKTAIEVAPTILLLIFSIFN